MQPSLFFCIKLSDVRNVPCRFPLLKLFFRNIEAKAGLIRMKPYEQT